MKSIIKLIAVLLIGMSTILGISSCKKDKGDENEIIDATNHFSVSFKDGYSNDYGWVVLHNLDGTEVIDYKKIEGDGTADFGEINRGTVTTTTIRVDTFYSNKGYESTYISISSDYSSPCGNWVFRGGGYNEEPYGTADITITYPENNYNEYYLSTTGRSSYSEDVPSGEINKQYNVNYLDDGNKYSIYGAVVQDNGGYCNWMLDQDFQLNQTNYYNLELNEPLSKTNFTTTKPIDYLYLYGYWNQRNSYLNFCIKDYWETAPNGEINHNVYYPADMPLSDLRFSGYYYNENTSYTFRKYYDMPQGLPDNIKIPDNTITATYIESTDEIADIHLTGTADQIHGNWDYWEYTDTTDFDIYWIVYTNWDYQSIKKPALPQEIIDDIGEEINMLEPYSIGLTDYNTTSNHADIINRFFVNDISVNQRYDEAFYYSYQLGNNKSRESNQKERERLKKNKHNYRH